MPDSVINETTQKMEELQIENDTEKKFQKNPAYKNLNSSAIIFI
jgi:hypothetical protein